MNLIAIKKFVDSLTRLAPKLDQEHKLKQGFVGFVLHDGVSFSLLDHFSEYAEVFLRFKRLINDSERFSEQFIEKHFRDLIVQTLKGKQADELVIIVQELIAEITSYDTLHTLYIPVDGIDIEKDETLGAITFKRATESFLQRLDQDIKDNKHYGFFGLIRNDVGGSIVAEYTTVAEPQRAYEKGVQETLRALEIIRFVAKCVYGYGNSIAVGLRGELFRGKQTHLILSAGRVAEYGSKATGCLERFSFAALSEVVRKDLGVNEFSRLLKKESVNSYEDMLLRCLHWFSSSQCHKELENKFLNLTTVLETIFSKNQGGSITNTIAEGTALILCSDVETRKKMKKDVRTLYGRRCAVSHGGSTVVSRIEAFQLEVIIVRLILKLVKRLPDFTRHQDLFEHVENLKFA